MTLDAQLPDPDTTVLLPGEHEPDRPDVVHQKARHLLPRVAGALVLATAVSAAMVSLALAGYPNSELPGAPMGLGVLLAAALWLRAVVVAGGAVVSARANRVAFGPTGIEVATGVLRRRKQVIWYYQLAEEPLYLRTPSMFLTHTASLYIRYNDTPFTIAALELDGIGSPKQAQRICRFLETKRLPQRLPIRGDFS